MSNETTTTTPKTFKLAQLARDVGHNEKIVRARFRRYANDAKNVERAQLVNSTLKNAKSRWIYPIELYDAIVQIVKRDDDE
jgi:P2-related tail formation protein